MLDYVIFHSALSSQWSVSCVILGRHATGRSINRRGRTGFFFFLSQELQKYSGEVKKLAAIITFHRLQEKAKTGRQLLMEGKKICYYVAQVSEYTSCPAI